MSSMNTRMKIGAVALAAVGALAAGCSSGGTDEVNGGVTVPSASQTAVPGPSATTAAPTAQPAAAPASGGGALDPPNCATGNLKVTAVDGDAAAGSRFVTLAFQNTGSAPCQLRGFPGVSYVTGDTGQQVGAAAAMSGPRGGEVRLAPGGSAGAVLQMAQAGNFDPAACTPTAVRGLRVYPPGEKASAFVPLETTGCAGTTPSPQLQVQTMTAR
ncbi:MAG: DUF4232 domain-containing protein [Pseudonocardia sp.]|nr:DUF4232 domain-containing protein [Pseudonocardia sp.]